MRRTNALSFKTQVMQQGAGSEPVQASLSEFLSLSAKIGTHLLAPLGDKGKNRNSLACLRNAGSHSADSYWTNTNLKDRKAWILSSFGKTTALFLVETDVPIYVWGRSAHLCLAGP